MDKPIVPREIRKVYEGRIFSLQIETLTLPKGGEMKAEIIRHPGSVVLIPMTAHGDILLVRQYRPAIGRWVWELPAGSLNPGEDAERAAAFETKHDGLGRLRHQSEVRRRSFVRPDFGVSTTDIEPARTHRFTLPVERKASGSDLGKRGTKHPARCSYCAGGAIAIRSMVKTRVAPPGIGPRPFEP